jgi:hypothetical protein
MKELRFISAIATTVHRFSVPTPGNAQTYCFVEHQQSEVMDKA